MAVVSTATSIAAAMSGSRSAGWSSRGGKACRRPGGCARSPRRRRRRRRRTPPVVEPDEDPADDVVHRRPLDAFQPLQRPSQARRSSAGRWRWWGRDLDVRVAAIRPHPPRVPGERRLEHAARHRAQLADVPVRDGVGSGHQGADGAGAGDRGLMREVQGAAGHRGARVDRRPREPRGGAGGLGEEARRGDDGGRGQRGTGDRDARSQPGRSARGPERAGQCHRPPCDDGHANATPPGGVRPTQPPPRRPQPSCGNSGRGDSRPVVAEAAAWRGFGRRSSGSTPVPEAGTLTRRAARPPRARPGRASARPRAGSRSARPRRAAGAGSRRPRW